MRTYYVGMDVHQASIVIVVLNGAGKILMELVVETGAESVRNFLKSLRGNVSVTFEEGTQAAWLHDLIRPLVNKVIVCDPRRNKLLAEGNKGDRVDALKLAQLLRAGLLRAVYHGNHGTRALKELVRNYSCLVSDTTRAMNRLKAVFRSRAIRCAGQEVYNQSHRNKWLAKLKERGVRRRTSFLYEELAVLMPLRRAAKKEMLKEARRHPAYQILLSIPLLGPVRVAQLIAVVETPYRFRNKRPFWSYVGLAVVTRTSAEYHLVNGKRCKRRRPAATCGLNRNHNHLLKKIFKSAAMNACSRAPYEAEYKARVKQGMAESMARLVIARKLAATTLAIWKRQESFTVKKMKTAA